MTGLIHDGARVIQVIETMLTLRGDGKETVMRQVRQYWSLEGALLAEVDPCLGNDSVAERRKSPTFPTSGES